MHHVVSDYTLNDNSNSTSNISVFIRARPPEKNSSGGNGSSSSSALAPPPITFLEYDNNEETQRSTIVIKEPGEHVSGSGGAVNKKYHEVKFQFDRIFWTDTSQDEMFNVVCRPLVDHVLRGYNACCFAYGQVTMNEIAVETYQFY